MPKRTRNDGEAQPYRLTSYRHQGRSLPEEPTYLNRKVAFLQQLAANPIIQADAWERDDLYDDPSS